MKSHPFYSDGRGKGKPPSPAPHPQKQNLVVYTEELTHLEAQILTESWRVEYNTERPQLATVM